MALGHRVDDENHAVVATNRENDGHSNNVRRELNVES